MTLHHYGWRAPRCRRPRVSGFRPVRCLPVRRDADRAKRSGCTDESHTCDLVELSALTGIQRPKALAGQRPLHSHRTEADAHQATDIYAACLREPMDVARTRAPGTQGVPAISALAARRLNRFDVDRGGLVDDAGLQSCELF